MKRKKLTKEQRKRISDKLKGRKLTKESIKKREETRRKNGWFRNIDKRNEKMRKALFRRKRPDVSKRMKGNKYGEKLRGRKLSKEIKEKISNAHKSIKLSREHRDNISKAVKKQYLLERRKAPKFDKIGIGENKKIMKKGIRKRDSHWAWFNHYGYFPKRDEVIHHIDGNRSNNQIPNLKLMTRKEHTKLHWADNKK